MLRRLLNAHGFAAERGTNCAARCGLPSRLAQRPPSPCYAFTQPPRQHVALTARAAATVDATPAVDEATDDAAGKAVHNSLRACTTATAVLDVAQREPLSARNTITALRALAKLSAKAPAPEQAALRSHDGFTMLLSTAEGHLPAMNAFQLSNCMQDVALLGAPVSAEFRATADAQVEALVSEFNARDVSSLWHAYSLMRRKPQPSTLAALTAVLQGQVQAGQQDPSSLSTILKGMAMVGHYHDGLIAAIVGQLQQQTARLQPIEVGNVMWSLATLGRYHAGIVTKCLTYLEQRPADFKTPELFNILWALAKLRHYPSGQFNQFVEYAVGRLGALRPADMATLFYACGMLGHHPGKVATAKLLPRLQELLPSCSPLQVTQLYWGLGLVMGGAEPSPAFSAAFNAVGARLPALDAAGKLSPSLLRQGFQGFLAARMLGEEASLPIPLLEKMKEAWTEKVHGAELSPMHREVSGMLRKLRVRHESKRPTRDGLVSIDIALQPTPTRFVALQIVGKHEMMANTGKLTGPAVYQRQLLEKNGWEVKFLFADEYYRIPEAGRPALLTDLVRSLGAKATAPSDAQAGRFDESNDDDKAGMGEPEGEGFDDDDDEEPGTSGSGAPSGERLLAISQMVRERLNSKRSVVKPNEFDLLMESGPEGARGGRRQSSGTRSRR